MKHELTSEAVHGWISSGSFVPTEGQFFTGQKNLQIVNELLVVQTIRGEGMDIESAFLSI